MSLSIYIYKEWTFVYKKILCLYYIFEHTQTHAHTHVQVHPHTIIIMHAYNYKYIMYYP